MSDQQHWQQVYQTKAADNVSWYQPNAALSLALIANCQLSAQSAIIDVGGGASLLVDTLLAQGYTNLTVLDLSAAALAVCQARLGASAAGVEWLVADVTKAELPRQYQLWHDRAVFHFLTDPAQRASYLALLKAAVVKGGRVIIATFAEDGPERCSGLPVQRYTAAALQAEFAGVLQLVTSQREAHQTPFGTTQHFTWCHFIKVV